MPGTQLCTGGDMFEKCFVFESSRSLLLNSYTGHLCLKPTGRSWLLHGVQLASPDSRHLQAYLHTPPFPGDPLWPTQPKQQALSTPAPTSGIPIPLYSVLSFSIIVTVTWHSVCWFIWYWPALFSHRHWNICHMKARTWPVVLHSAPSREVYVVPGTK